MGAGARDSRDLLASTRGRLVLFVLPQVAFLAGFVLPSIRPVLWPVALGILGTACLANALRCGRIHCYFTGPFYLLAAATIALYELGRLPLGSRGWLWLGIATVVVGNVLAYVPDRLRPRYRRSPVIDG